MGSPFPLYTVQSIPSTPGWSIKPASTQPAPMCTSSGICGCHDTPRMTRHTAVVVVGSWIVVFGFEFCWTILVPDAVYLLACSASFSLCGLLWQWTAQGLLPRSPSPGRQPTSLKSRRVRSLCSSMGTAGSLLEYGVCCDPHLVAWLLCLHLFVGVLLLRVWTSSEVFWARHTLSMSAGWKTAANAAATGVLPGLLPLHFGKSL